MTAPSSPRRYVCVHGHFYQPPRESPWLEAVEREDSAYPFHDWNERVTAEAYRPNAYSRILNGEGRIEKIVNNYTRISFNFGPTLLSWMEDKDPELYRAIQRADRSSRERFGGHGSALAQVYNHMIMPLASLRDKQTQVRWGLADFERRFERKAEGMWLAETAVDTETLEVLAAHDLKFTVLAPNQCAKVRGPSQSWQDVSNGRVNPRRPYRVALPSGRSIVVFFYDGPLSRAVAFERLLNSGVTFARRLLGAFEAGDEPQLVHIATDGETYGHHHRHGDMALAYALQCIEGDPEVRLTNYGELLELVPATWEAQIVERSSWSCAHGVERWRSDCGCRIGGETLYNQKWRAPLREALNSLRDHLEPLYREHAGALLRDPEAARDAYINVVLSRSDEVVSAFFEEHQRRPLSPEEQITVLQLLEMQRHAMLMFTSCGWFFDDIAGIEAHQILKYAGRALQLAEQRGDGNIRERFLSILEGAPSSTLPGHNGRTIFEEHILPMFVDLPKLAAHYAARSLFEDYGDRAQIYCFDVEAQHRQTFAMGGRRKLALGHVHVRSRVTRKGADLVFAVLHFGDHNLWGGVRRYRDEAAYRDLVRRAQEAVSRADLPAVIRMLSDAFPEPHYNMGTLFRDEQRAVLDVVLEKSLQDAEEVSWGLYERHAPLMRYLASIDYPIPASVLSAATFVINAKLHRAAAGPMPSVQEIRALLQEAHMAHITVDVEVLAYILVQSIEGWTGDWEEQPPTLDGLERVTELTKLLADLPHDVELTVVQNRVHTLLTQPHPEAEVEWHQKLAALGETLGMKVQRA